MQPSLEDRLIPAVARGLNKTKPKSPEEGYPRWASTVISVSHELASTVPSFDATGFLNAAGLGAFQD